MFLSIASIVAVWTALYTTTVHAIPATTPSCTNIPPPLIQNATVISVTSNYKQNYTPPTLNTTSLNICEVNVTFQHTGANDIVRVQTWLPHDNWNNRFAAIGGGAWAAGLGEPDLALPASQGYAVSSTDAGLLGDPYSPGPWALKPDGTVNVDLLTNFASRSIHDMATVGKAVTAAFYGKHAKYSYWNGCSTGGRQGLVAAQQYPIDFDGIVAGSPASHWTEYVVAELWPQVVMKEAGYYPSACELDTIVSAATKACDNNDHIQDDIIDNPFQCDFDPFSLVGTKISCDGAKHTISKKLASIVRQIWDGPRTPCGKKLWYGLPIGASLTTLAKTKQDGDNVVGEPFGVADAWVRYFVKANASFDTASLDTASFTQLFYESKRKFGDLIGSANPDLNKFNKSGGKLLVWHGLADEIIFPQGSIQYWNEVQQKLGGQSSSIDNFFRLFLAPGLDHCGFNPTNPGAKPTSPFEAMVDWVEAGAAPDFLLAETSPQAPAQFTRKICHYPLTSKYQGSGDPNASNSYECV